jgi:hypothetical protein
VLLTETIFYHSQAVGLMLQNSNTGRVTFQPAQGLDRLAKRTWASIDACRKAVTRTWRKESDQWKQQDSTGNDE